ncbi:MAG TPA: serine hydrolase domain-containing protein [Blastocatellia bacterium]|nr:serine hydrolase domain-containing protein [Blastocatellia bacterium]
MRLPSRAALSFALPLLLTLTAAAQTINTERLAAALEPEIRRAMSEGNIPSCTVALVAGDRIIWTGAYGYSNVRARVPAKTDTVYLIGSTFKAMSTMALLQLMEQGKFRLDDPVSQYLTEFKIRNEDPQQPVTFRHLLTHTSGMPADFGPFPLWGDAAPPRLEDYLSSSLKVTEAPLKKVVYSNMAYSLVGYLVQKLSGVPFKHYVQEHIFAPLEMNDTVFAITPEMEERLSIPYVFDAKTNRQIPTQRLRAAVWPAGLVYGTVTDQANWLIANLNNGVFKGRRIISEATINQMFTRQYDQFKGPVEGLWGNGTAGFGLTWWVQERDGEHWFAHSGSVPGYTAFLLGNRDQKLGFAILTNGNRAHPHLIKLADKALDLLRAQKMAASGR